MCSYLLLQLRTIDAPFLSNYYCHLCKTLFTVLTSLARYKRPLLQNNGAPQKVYIYLCVFACMSVCACMHYGYILCVCVCEREGLFQPDPFTELKYLLDSSDPNVKDLNCY